MSFIVYFSIAISILYCWITGSNSQSYIMVLPWVYLLSFSVLKGFATKKSNYQISVIMVLALLWIRMIFLPMYGLSEGLYSRMDSNVDSLAVILCCYECLVVTIVLLFIATKKDSVSKQDLTLRGSPTIYMLFILFALGIFVIYGRDLSLFEFGIKTIGERIDREGDITDERVVIIRQIVSSGYLFLFFCFISSLKKSFDISKNRSFLYCSILLSAMMVCVIIGERRSAQIYIAFSCIWLLSHIYSKYSKRIILSIGSVALFVLITMTIYKQFNAFLYNSYEEAVHYGSFSEGMSAGIIDAYFNGIDTIAKNIKFAQTAGLSISNLFYDFFRSFFGLHYFLKGGLLTSEIYNLQIYGGGQSTGLLLSSVGYGYIYLGPIFAPLFTVFNVIVVCFLEKRMRSTSSIEMSYIWAFVYMRFAYGFLLSFPQLLNSASRYLIINGLIIFFATISKRPSKAQIS